MSAAKQIWRAFNRWRKRCWPFRVTILCLLLLNTLVGAWFMPTLVRKACDAMLGQAESSFLDATYRSNKANAIRGLQASLVGKLDVDGDGELSAAEEVPARDAGLDPAQLSRAPLQADLEQLVAAAQRAEIAPRALSGRAIRREAWRDAVVETQKVMRPERERVDAAVSWWKRPDYASLSTWRRGLVAFYEQFLLPNLYGLIGNPFHWIPFFVATYLAAVIAVVLLRGRQALAALLTAVIISGAMNGVWAAVLPHSIRDYWLGPSPPNWLRIVCDSCLILAAAVAGARRGARFGNRARALHVSILVLGAVLLAWGALPTPHPGLHFEPGYGWPFLLDGEVFPSMKAWMCVIGLTVLVAYPILLLRHRRRQRQRRLAVA